MRATPNKPLQRTGGRRRPPAAERQGVRRTTMEQRDLANCRNAWRAIGIMAVVLSWAGGTAAKASSKTPARDPQGSVLQAEMDLVASKCVAGGGRPIKVYDARKFFPWVSVGRLYGVVSRDPRGHVYAAAFGDGAAPTCLTGASKETLGEYLSKQFQGRFPGLQSVPQIGKFLKDVVLWQGSVIGDQELIEDQKQYHSWTGRGGRERDTAAFEKLCTGVRGSVSGNAWRLAFNAFRPDGGVDLLTAFGVSEPLTITGLTVEEVEPAGEFSYPIEGWHGPPPNKPLQRTNPPP